MSKVMRFEDWTRKTMAATTASFGSMRRTRRFCGGGSGAGATGGETTGSDGCNGCCSSSCCSCCWPSSVVEAEEVEAEDEETDAEEVVVVVGLGGTHRGRRV